MVTIKTEDDIEKLREGGKRLATVLADTVKKVAPGVSTADLSEYAKRRMDDLDGIPSFLNYTPSGAKRPYPAPICVCINDEIVHGIPNEDPQIIQEGDIVTVDAGLIYKDLYTDHAITVAVGAVPKPVRRLLDVTREALASGIKQAVPGNRVGDISAAIEAQAKKAGLSIIQGLAGHGVGYGVHEEPLVPNEGRAGKGELLRPGMVLAIEPMFGLGTPDIILDRDGYTYLTADGSLSAQFEHTVLITDDQPEILTKL